MNIFALSGFINTITVGILSIFVYLKNRRSIINKKYALFCFFVATWSLFYYLWQSSDSKETALFLCRGLMAGAIFIPVSFLDFILMLVYEIKQKKFIWLSYLIFSIFLILDFTPFFIKDVNPKLFFKFWPEPGIAFGPFLFLWGIYCIYPFYLIFREYKNISGLKKEQLKYVAIGTFIGYLGGSTNYFLWYNLPILPYGNILVSVSVCFMAYAIIKYRLMDIRVAITRFGIFVVVYAAVLGIPFWLGYKYHLWHYSTLLMAILATLGPFIYLRLEKRSKELLYKTEFKRYETLRRFSKTLLLIKELDKLVELIVYRLAKTLKVTYAGIYLYDKEKDVYVLKSYRPLKYPNVPKEITLTKEDLLIKLLFIWRRELIREEVANLPLSKKVGSNNHIDLGLIQHEMHKLSATLIIPHFLENDLLGFLVLGDKEKGAIYTQEDVSILSALSNSAALAIENALFLIDLKITQAELFNAKRIAELGYMASAMGHEINNRLQAIYSAALDMVDNPVIYESIKQNPDLKAAFDKDIAFINENVEDATKIINELKTYARPQDRAKQAFEPINVKDVIEKAINVVRLQSIKAFDMIDLDINISPTTPNILGNFIQLQQVFVNMLNNAHDAIIQMKEYINHHAELNLTDYRGSIKITAQEAKNKLNIHIIDNGIGMTEEIRKCVFIPLYTSKASSDRKANRDIKGGTGIGLYTIQTIIRGHNGSIEVYNTERLKETDFLITLPVAREKDLQEQRLQR